MRPPVLPAHFRQVLLAHGSFSTHPDWPIDQRLWMLSRGLAEVLTGTGVQRLVIEVPRYDGMNAAKRRQAKTRDGFAAGDMASCNRAIGALLLAGRYLGIPEVVTERASGVDKRLKSAWVVNIWPDLGLRRSNADERDAIHLACVYLLAHPDLGKVA